MGRHHVCLGERNFSDSSKGTFEWRKMNIGKIELACCMIDHSKRMGGSDKGTLNIGDTCKLLTCSHSQGHSKHKGEDRWTLFLFFCHFPVLLLFGGYVCPFFPLMKRIPLMLPPLAFPSFHCSPPSSPFLFFSAFAGTHFWVPANLPSLGQEPRQTLSAPRPWPGACWEPPRFLSVSLCPSRMYCLLLGRSWPEDNS